MLETRKDETINVGTFSHVCGSPVPFFIYFEFYVSLQTIKAQAIFLRFHDLKNLYLFFCLSSIKHVSSVIAA